MRKANFGVVILAGMAVALMPRLLHAQNAGADQIQSMARLVALSEEPVREAFPGSGVQDFKNTHIGRLLLQVGFPFAAYFLGILIRKCALPAKDSPSLASQCLLGIPVSLVVVSPALILFKESLKDPSAYLVMLGIVMEHGMLVAETATRQLQKMLAQEPAGPAGPSVAAQPEAVRA